AAARTLQPRRQLRRAAADRRRADAVDRPGGVAARVGPARPGPCRARRQAGSRVSRGRSRRHVNVNPVRIMEITTPLGPDVLLFHTMHGREELSRVSEYRLELLSLKNDIDIDVILGKN